MSIVGQYRAVIQLTYEQIDAVVKDLAKAPGRSAMTNYILLQLEDIKQDLTENMPYAEMILKRSHADDNPTKPRRRTKTTRAKKEKKRTPANPHTRRLPAF